MTQTTPRDASFSLNDLLYLMSRLRKPDTGCPWDLKQDYRSITPSTIEEAYEVVDAIEREDYGHLKDELGDLLFQVVFYSQLAGEDQHFGFDDVVHSITEKLLRRHPHVFPDGTLESERSTDGRLDDKAINANWEAIKQSERNDKGSDGIFDDIPRALPGISRAAKLQKRAAKVGFDWEKVEDIVDKLGEEKAEFAQAVKDDNDAAIEEELGDLFFTCVNLARYLGKEPEAIMRQANQKFEARINAIDRDLHERSQGQGLASGQRSPQELDALWHKAKRDLAKSD